MHGRELKLNKYGKPSKETFGFASDRLMSMQSDFEISNIYVIGDNPESDIKGGNMMGFKTILV